MRSLSTPLRNEALAGLVPMVLAGKISQSAAYRALLLDANEQKPLPLMIALKLNHD